MDNEIAFLLVSTLMVCLEKTQFAPGETVELVNTAALSAYRIIPSDDGRQPSFSTFVICEILPTQNQLEQERDECFKRMYHYLFHFFLSCWVQVVACHSYIKISGWILKYAKNHERKNKYKTAESRVKGCCDNLMDATPNLGIDS